MKHTRKIVAASVIAVAILASAESCDDTSSTTADSDSSQNYATDSKIPFDTKAYEITGEVAGPVNDLTRQVKPAQGSVDGFAYGGYASLNGSFTGPIQAGKGFVRLLVSSATPATDLAPVGQVTIIKTSDTKAKALVNGDIVSFKCRRQYENIAAVKDNQKLNVQQDGTWELDYCRLSSPVIKVKK